MNRIHLFIIITIVTASLVTTFVILCLTYDSQLFYTPANFVRDHLATPVRPPLGATVRSRLRAPFRTKILLVTYHRGGSSFLGEIFAQNDDLFYWYEPLRNLHRLFPARLRSHVDIVERFYEFKANGNLTYLSRPLLDVLIKTIDDVLNCDVIDVDRHVLSEEFMIRWVHMPRMRVYAECMILNIEHVLGVQTCYDVLQLACAQSDAVVAKTVRFPVYAIADLLARDPTVKVVYYVRDPRAVLMSRADRFGESQEAMTRKAPLFCRQVAEDFGHYDQTKRKHPDNIVLIRYEDLAYRPIDTAASLYKYAEMDLPPSVRHWIVTSTQATRSDGRVGTLRNSSATAGKWRQTIRDDILVNISIACREVLDALGYEV